MKPFFARALLVGVFAAVSACSQQQAQQPILVTAANETAAIARLRAIAAAEARYQIESGGSYGTLDQLIQKRYVNDPSLGKLTGYRFEVQVRPVGFQVTAIPEKVGVTGNRSFYVDETNVVRAADKKGAPATASDPEA